MNESNMQHALHWEGENVTGWFVSEKYDGCRAYWDGQTLWSRGGKVIEIPETWRSALPTGIALDGEVYFGIGGSRKCATAIRHGRFIDGMTFIVFDVPEADGDYQARMDTVRGNEIVRPVAVSIARSTEHAQEEMASVHARGGEGLMLRHPDLQYRPGRTNKMLKMKGYLD